MKTRKMQNIILAEDGVIRFQENKIVSFLLENSSYDLNSLHMEDFHRKDWEQFNQLIGYSVSAYGSMEMTSKKVAKKADKKALKLYKKITKSNNTPKDIAKTSK